MRRVLRTSGNRLLYWLTGSVLLWLLLPAQYFDMILAPEWHAPNPQCDSLGPLIWEMQASLLPWTAVVAVLSAVVALALPRGREAGVAVFAFRIGSTLRNATVTAILSVLMLPLAFDVVCYVWEVIVPHTIAGDCGGRADLVSIYGHRPIVQPSAFVEAALLLWLLHIRTLLLSKRV